MSDPIMVAVVSAVGLILSGVLVEVIRSRRDQRIIVEQVTANSGRSMHDSVARIELDVVDIRTGQKRNTARIDSIEAKVDDIAGGQ